MRGLDNMKKKTNSLKITLILAIFLAFTIPSHALNNFSDAGTNNDGTIPIGSENAEISSNLIETRTSPSDVLVIPSSETFNLIGTLDVCNGGNIASYDTDHDGNIELIYERKQSGVFPAIFYENNNDEFTLVHTLDVYGPVWDAGDFDNDGKSDLIVQRASELRVYESSDENSYPTELVWSSSLTEPIYCFATGGFDLDEDGLHEIIVANNFLSGHTMRIYECDGDNAYTLVFETPAFEGNQVGIVAGDFDRDGATEFLASNAPPDIIIYENDGDDSYHETSRLEYHYYNNGRSFIGNDLDKDGLSELILGGEDIHNSCIDFVDILESNADDSYLVTSEIEFPFDNACGTRYCPIVGNVLGYDKPELVISGYREWYIYNSTGENQYEEIYAKGEASNIAGQIFLANTNNNDYQEIIIASHYIGSTKVYETEIGGPLSCTTYGPYSGVVDEQIQFEGSAIGGVPPYEYNWSFGNGNFSDEEDPTYGYDAPGEYVVSLTVTDSERAVAIDYTTATITEPVPEIKITNIEGGLGVITTINNTGDVNAEEVEWKIVVTGGILGRINKTINGTIDIKTGEFKTVQTGIFFGLGNIDIKVIAGSEEETAVGTQFFIFTRVKG